jgi:cytochrome b subunit of formate dehydrogenase
MINEEEVKERYPSWYEEVKRGEEVAAEPSGEI